MDKNNLGIILVFVSSGLFLLAFGIYFILQTQYGDYIIQRQWISSVREGINITYCDNCLWIEFYEGCNHYSTYYFENQHELDPRFPTGSVVNIRWKTIEGEKYIKNIVLASRFRSKC